MPVCSFSTCIKWHNLTTNDQQQRRDLHSKPKSKWFNANDIPFKDSNNCDDGVVVVAFQRFWFRFLVDRMPRADHLCMQKLWL